MDGQTKSTKDRYLMIYLSNKKRILNIGRLELVLEGGGGTDRQTGGHLADVKTYFPFFKFFQIKKMLIILSLNVKTVELILLR